MAKTTTFTTISPLPPLSRDVVLDCLHNHTDMIDMNPLVVERHFINPPPNAAFDERDCVWYSMTDKIHYLPGGKVSGDVSYTCAFHDLPHGLQTHCRAPLGVDVRSRWTLNGSLPGEPQQPVELALGAPSSGLYLREDVELRCNILMTPFVKKNLKRSHAVLVAKLVEKAAHLSSQIESSTAADMESASPPPPQASTGLHRRPSSVASRPCSHESLQEPSTPPPRIQVSDPFARDSASASQTSTYQVLSHSRTPSQHSAHADLHAEPTPVLRMPSSYSYQAHGHRARPSAPRVPAQPPAQPPPQAHRQQLPGLVCPPYPTDVPLPYPDDESVVPGPLRLAGASARRSRATSSASSSWSSSSSELELALSSHPSPNSPMSSDRSSEPDEPDMLDVAAPAVSKGYLDEMHHPAVLRPGNGKWSGRSSGPSFPTA